MKQSSSKTLIPCFMFHASCFMNSCHLCQKTHTSGCNVPHSKKKTKRAIRANLQFRKIDGQRVKICTRCIKSL